MWIQQPSEIKTDRTEDPLKEKLHGTWVLTKDDEYVGQTFPNEKLYFHKDGKLLIDGPNFICGRYKVLEDYLQIIVPVKGHEIAYFRKFFLDQTGLHLENLQKGFAHYKQRKGMLELCIPDEEWKLQVIGRISFKVPQEWFVSGGEPNKNGIQELQLTNPDDSKLLLAVRLPTGIGYPQKKVIKITREIASSMLLATPMAGFHLLPAGVDNYFGITGATFLAETKNPPLTLKVVIKRLHQAAAIVFILYSNDQLLELENIAQLIYVDGVPISSK
jgi:hypothetical protein